MKAIKFTFFLALIVLAGFGCEEDPVGPEPPAMGNETIIFRVYYGQYAAPGPIGRLNMSQPDFIDEIYTHTAIGDNNGIIEFERLVPGRYHYDITYTLQGQDHVARGIVDVEEGIPAQASIYF